MPDALQQILGWLPVLIRASGITLLLTVTSVSAALVLSVFLALGKIARPHDRFLPNAASTGARWLSSAYVFFFRGTPLLMQLFFLYYTLPNIVPSLTIKDRFLAAFIAFTLNVAAYLAEIIRAAVQSIEPGSPRPPTPWA
jgi:polar amino acid transport system permease protein